MNNLTMKKFVYIVALSCFAVSLTSCGAGASATIQEKDQIAGYTLKNKKEIMKQKILYNSGKTQVVIP